MITISKIKEYLQSLSDIQVIAKDFSVTDYEYHLVGFYKMNGEQKMLLLAFNEDLSDLIEEYDCETAGRFYYDKELTVREEEKMQIRYETYLPHIKSINGHKICSSQKSPMSNYEAEHALLLAEFIKNGWESEGFANKNPNHIFVVICSFADYEAEDVQENLTLSFAPENSRFTAEIPITLEIEGPSREIILPSYDRVFIRRVSTFDLHKHTDEVFASEKIRSLFSAEELEEMRRESEKINEKHCPKGKRFITVEYEAPENISLNIQPKATLDSPRKRSNGAFAVLCSASMQAEHEGYKMRVATITEPFDPEIKTLEAEIFSYSVTTELDNIDL